MRFLVRFILVALVAISSFSFLQQTPTPVEAGTAPVDNSFFDGVSFECPNVINFSGQWESFGDDAFITINDVHSGEVLDGQFFGHTDSGINTFSGSFSLTEPLPDSVLVVLWQGSPGAIASKSVGLAERYSPPILAIDNEVTPPLPPEGEWRIEDFILVTIPECETVSGCTSAFPIYGTALVLDQQLGFSEPNGEPARDAEGNLIWVLHDVDQDGQDTYLIIDIQTGTEGETWLGIFIGACDPVYVPLNKVYPLNAIPVD